MLLVLLVPALTRRTDHHRILILEQGGGALSHGATTALPPSPRRPKAEAADRFPEGSRSRPRAAALALKSRLVRDWSRSTAPAVGPSHGISQ